MIQFYFDEMKGLIQFVEFYAMINAYNILSNSFITYKYWTTIYRDLSPIQLTVVSIPIEDF